MGSENCSGSENDFLLGAGSYILLIISIKRLDTYGSKVLVEDNFRHLVLSK